MSRTSILTGQMFVLPTERSISLNLNKSPLIKGLNLDLRFIVNIINNRRSEQTYTL